MSGYKYRDPSRVGNQPVFTATDKRAHELEQENALLKQKLTKALQARQPEVAASAATGEALEALQQRVLELVQERDHAVETLTGRVDVNRDRVRHLLVALRKARVWPGVQARVHRAVLHTMIVGYATDKATNRDRVRALLGTLRTERQELAGERSRRQHAEMFLSRSEQRTDQVRSLLGEERDQFAAEVRDFQDTIAGLEDTIGELRARLAQRHDVVTETRVADLEGALADQQQITADRTRERDMARGQAIAAWATVDRTHTLLTRNQVTVFEAKRLARAWGIDFERPEGEVA